ncbi:MAG: DsrE/DsrF/TusD sulfur relay family protein [Promethearchaeota archaeon]
MVKFTFILCAEPYKYEAMDTLINLGEAIIKKGHHILGIFLYGSGVYNIKGDILTDDSTRNLPERLANFCKKYNARLAACSTWINFSGIKSSEFIEGACQEGLGGLSDLIARSDRVIFFGPGG